MATDYSETALRRYVLGDMADEETAALEHDYVARPELFDRVWSAENDLIDDYLGGRLAPDDRSRFERYYLATPVHRDRVAVARELRAAATAGSVPRWPGARRLAAVAALVLLAVGGMWMLRSRSAPPTVALRTPPSPPSQVQEPPRAAPVVVAMSLSPTSVRGTDDATQLTIAPGTDLVVLRLEGDPNGPVPGRGRAVVRTVSNNEVWRGAATSEGTRPNAIARVEIPAGTLTPDDYIVGLLTTGSNGRESEMYRYVLRVRAR